MDGLRPRKRRRKSSGKSEENESYVTREEFEELRDQLVALRQLLDEHVAQPRTLVSSSSTSSTNTGIRATSDMRHPTKRFRAQKSSEVGKYRYHPDPELAPDRSNKKESRRNELSGKLVSLCLSNNTHITPGRHTTPLTRFLIIDEKKAGSLRRILEDALCVKALLHGWSIVPIHAVLENREQIRNARDLGSQAFVLNGVTPDYLDQNPIHMLPSSRAGDRVAITNFQRAITKAMPRNDIDEENTKRTLEAVAHDFLKLPRNWLSLRPEE